MRASFAVMAIRGTEREPVADAETVRELEEAAQAVGDTDADSYVAVRYRRCGYDELARADTPGELANKVGSKAGAG